MSLVLEGDRLGVLLNGGPTPGGSSGVRLLDVSNPATPTDIVTVPIAGSLLDGRVVDGVLHLVTGWYPGPFAFTYPTDSSPGAVEQAREANRQVVRESTIEQWVPPGVACDTVRHPRDLAGFSSTVVTSIPLEHPSNTTNTTLLADAGTVYASTDRLVVATQRWDWLQTRTIAPGPSSVRTNLHRFALDPGGARYTASGSVPGFTRSPYSLSEHEGFLRVASTDQPFPAPDGPSSSSTVTVLDEEDGLLVPVGSVGGLGVGQQIQGVRFVGDVGYVVTFLRTDPLYTIDLSDPSNPTVRGALEVTGFSGYLHPLGDGRLLGVGVEADDAGTAVGGAVSIYDVGDLDRPALAQRLVDSDARYMATDDPHAFLLWEPTGQLVLPAYGVSGGGGAAVFRIDHGQVTAQGRIDHAGHPTSVPEGTDPSFVPAPFVSRAAMVGDVLYTVSFAGVLASDPSTLADIGWAALPQPAPCCYAL